jgi:hypothetical protein
MISIMVEALTNPARLLDRFGISGAPEDGVRKILGRANRLAVALGRSPSERVGVVRDPAAAPDQNRRPRRRAENPTQNPPAVERS